jgi:hypothetical protein
MPGACKVCAFLACILSIIDYRCVFFTETGGDDATAAFGLLAVKYLIDTLEDPKLDFVPTRAPVTAPTSPVDAIPSSDDFVLRCQDTRNAELRLAVSTDYGG